METWINKVESRLLKLESLKLININNLTERPEFSALLLRAIQVAAVTSQAEQLEAIQNYIINLSKEPSIPEDELYIILEIISGFTPSHVQALKFYHAPCDYHDQIVNYMKETDKQGIGPGDEMAYIFGQGDADYWQNIFIMLRGKNIVEPGSIMIEPGSPDLIVRAKATALGVKAVSMIEKDNDSQP